MSVLLTDIYIATWKTPISKGNNGKCNVGYRLKICVLFRTNRFHLPNVLRYMSDQLWQKSYTLCKETEKRHDLANIYAKSCSVLAVIC